MLMTQFLLQAIEQSKRYEALSTQCRIVSGQQDLNSFLKFLQPESPPKVPRKAYAPPQLAPGDNDDTLDYNVGFFVYVFACKLTLIFRIFVLLQDQSPVPLKNELIIERNASLQVRPSVEALKREAIEIELQIRQLQVSVGSRCQMGKWIRLVFA